MPPRRLAAALLVLAGALGAQGAERTTFSVDYLIRISPQHPERAQVRWLLAGIDEIRSFRIVFRDDRMHDVSGSGTLEWQGRTLRWTPRGPYAHLRYTVTIAHPRPPGPRFDGYAADDWVATRALHLFPEINVDFRPGAQHARGRARLLLYLPKGWQSATALAPLAEHAYEVVEPGKRFARPRGWLLLGRIDRHRRTIAGSDVTVATAPGSALDARRLLRLYARTMPLLAAILGPPPPRLLLVSAPDPMWHGGLSGEDSFFVNGRIPLRSTDKTSSYLHELFHVWQPFRPGRDGRWISEGFAEYYSLALQHRAGRLSDAAFARGVALFARFGRWDLDLTRSRVPAALNNSAPYVMACLDQRIRDASEGRRSLDDVVHVLAAGDDTLTTGAFLRALNQVTGSDFSAFLRRHVERGVRPDAPALGH